MQKLIIKINIMFIKILIKFKLIIFRRRIENIVTTILSAEDHIALQYITKLRWQVSNNNNVDEEFSTKFLNLLTVLEKNVRSRNSA